MACYAGFLTGREAARLMLPRGRGNIFFTGATAGMRGGVGYAPFASAKFPLPAVPQGAARRPGLKKIHVAHLAIHARSHPPLAPDPTHTPPGRPPPADHS